jgi:hypothetical protein
MFKIHSDKNYMILEGGMSPEMCLTKYLAKKSGKVYQGWKPTSFFSKGNVVHETLGYICGQIRKVTSLEKRCVVAPGILSVPYIVDLTDSMYLPSQLLVSVKNIADLKDVLDSANSMGIKCYAEVGYDGCMPEGLVAWIKFLELPQLYIDLLLDLNVDTVINLSVNKVGLSTPGENLARVYSSVKSKSASVTEGSIILLYINEGYGNATKEEEEKLFKRLVSDFNFDFVRQKVTYIQDWESGTVKPEVLLSNWKGCKYIICAEDTLQIYDLSWYLTREFIKINGIEVKGVVMNPYFVNNPLYEAYYGYLAYNYWQQNSSSFEHFKKLRGEQKGELWINTFAGDTNKVVSNLDVKEVTNHINMTSSYSGELGIWIKEHKPESYSGMEYISLFTFKRICKALGMDVYEDLAMPASNIAYLEKRIKDYITFWSPPM